MLFNFRGTQSVPLAPSPVEFLSTEMPNPLLGRGVWGNEPCECPHRGVWVMRLHKKLKWDGKEIQGTFALRHSKHFVTLKHFAA